MPSVNCPVPGCNYATPDTEAVIVAALITAHANSTHNGPAQAGQGTTKVEKVKRPTIVSSSTSEDWTYFLTRWNEYKQATRVAGREIIIQLLECCEEQLRKDLTRSSVGPLTEKTEDDILAAIKSLAVREENIMVARVALNNMHQDQEESIRAFGARLRGQAAVCRYVIDCPGDECNIVVDYTEQILRDVFCRGIGDPDIQLELLGHTNQDMTLEEVFHFVEAKEAGKRSANRLLDNQAAAIRSNYSKSKRDTLKQSSQTDKTDKVDKNSKCSYCGTFGHGTNSTSQSRRNSCPAFNHTCGYCHRPHHFDHVCRSKDKPKRVEKKSDNASIQEESNSVFNTLCAVSSNASTESPIAHHCYDPSTNTWKKRSSKSQPFIPLSIQVAEEDYLQLGFKPIAFESKTIQVRAMADTGCQSCLISFKHIQRLGLNKKDLLPTTMKLVFTKRASVGSRFTSPAESRYAPVEGEALAVAYSLDRARHFVLGCKELIIAVDHKPLLGLFTNRSLDDIPNNRLENLKELTLRYRFSMYHIPGLKHRASDATSRYPTGDPSPEPLFLQDDIAPINVSNYTLQSIQSITWDKVRLLSASDPEMKQLIDFIDSNMSASKNEIPASVQPFHQFIDHLSTVDGVALYKDRVIIPKQLRQAVLIALHAAHHGVTSMTARADSSVFWPGISKDIVKQRNNCNHCDRIAPSQPSAPPTPLAYPEYPFQYLCGDFFHHKGHYYLVCVDRYSNWPIVEESKEGATSLINCLRRSFVTYGIPDELSSDGGPEFTASSTETFLKNWGVKHRRSSVAFPHSNCRAEIGVKTVKRMLTDNSGPNGELDTESFQRAMLQYRNTPNQDTKLSPAMCLFGRPIKDFIPILPGKYLPHSTWQNVLQDRENALRHRHMKIAERLEQHTRRLPPLRVGDRVRLQNQVGPHPKKWDKTGSVVEVRQHDQYVVRVDGSRRVTPRNRKFLRRYVPVHQTPQFVGSDIPVPISPTAQQLLNTPRETTYAPGVSPTPRARLTEQTHPSKNPSAAPSSDGPTSTLDPTPTTNAQAPALRRSSRIRKPPSYLTDFQT
ncbi:uncharacterized protein [Clytia hemisphaerica]|uniref:uncharacterized protein n=1 Tax=Clytia hemisphaerica TaxID=252671 RepID=UPI0034D48404